MILKIMTGTQSMQKQMLTLHLITWNKDSLLSSIGTPPRLKNGEKGCKCTWLTYKIKNLMNTRDKVFRKARKTNKESDWSRYKRVQNLCNNEVKQAKQKYQKDLLFENRNKSTEFWNCIKEMFPSKESVPISVTNIGNVKNTENANSICTFFTNIAQNLKYETFKLRNFIGKNHRT